MLSGPTKFVSRFWKRGDQKFVTYTFGILVLLQCLAQFSGQSIKAPEHSTLARVSHIEFKFQSMRTEFRFEDDGTGSRDLFAQVRILTDAGAKQWPSLDIEYRPSAEKIRIDKLLIRHKDGRVTPVESNLNRQSSSNKAGISDFDYDEQRIALPPLSPGDLVEYRIHTTLGAAAEGQFWTEYTFHSRDQVRDEQLEIDTPLSRHIGVRTLPGIQVQTKTSNGRRRLSWRKFGASGISQTNRQPPRTVVPDVQLTSFSSWEEVGRWYAEIERPQRDVSSEIKATADDLTKETKADVEKAQRLYAFVAGQVRYISLDSLGVGGYQPHFADETLRRRYGDCKDKATLLAALLSAKGLRSALVLISDNHDLDLLVPSPFAFTHVLNLISMEHDRIWMDASFPNLKFGTVLPAFQGRKALIIPTEGPPYLATTPSS